ncbi:MAG: SGNH/GDSL hydrolase family protein [Parvibaculaceae bacterium]
MRYIVGTLVGVLLAALILMIVEGVNAVAHWSRPSYSLTRKLASFIGLDFSSGETVKFPYRAVLTTDGELVGLLPELKKINAGIGNSPYSALRTDESAMNTKKDGCLVQKPNLDKTMTYLRSTLFNPLDPPNLFFDTNAQLSPALQAFVDKYAVRKIRHRTDAAGHRLTFPDVQSDEHVLIAGDSTAVSAMVNDEETVASSLQKLDPARRYINLGIAGAAASDVICALEDELKSGGGKVAELIYFYCENDFDKDDKFGTPAAVVERVKALTGEKQIPKVTIIYMPYIYNVVPQFTRFDGSRGELFPTNVEERADLKKRSEEAGFRYLDYGEIALAEGDAVQNQFSTLGMYTDVAHASPAGIQHIVARLRQN